MVRLHFAGGCGLRKIPLKGKESEDSQPTGVTRGASSPAGEAKVKK